jgi:hypothetical protein
MFIKNRRSKKRLTLEEKQAGGSPAYRFHGDSGLLSQSSLGYSPIGLTSHEQNFSDHIVATSGGGRRRRGSRRRGSRRRVTKRRGSRRRGSRRRGSRR